MKRWWQFWLNDPPAAVTPAAPPARPGEAPAPPAACPALEPLWMAWLEQHLGPGTPPPHAAHLARQALTRLVQARLDASTLIPRVPSVVPQLLKSLRDEQCGERELAALFARDALLVAELLNEVNRAHFHQGANITSLDQAVRLLGQNGLRMLVARVAFRPLIQIQSGPLTGQLAPLLWQRSSLSADAARLLAGRAGCAPFSAYLAGLMSQLGTIVALRAMDQVGVCTLMPEDASFQHDFAAAARTLGARTAASWALPEEVCVALTTPPHGAADALSEVLRAALQLAQFLLLEKAGCLDACACEAWLQAHPEWHAPARQLRSSL